MVELLFSIGPVSYAGMGEVPLTEFDILCWRLNRGRSLDDWEIDALKTMSAAYMRGRYEGEHPGSVRPFIDRTREEAIERRSASQDAKLKSFFGGILAAQGDKMSKRK
ncbi:MAG TPA: hypothetical protein VFV43_09130 [Limnobacter sp.]|nr:hypothetical protein [Limnobacter sp.]